MRFEILSRCARFFCRSFALFGRIFDGKTTELEREKLWQHASGPYAPTWLVRASLVAPESHYLARRRPGTLRPSSACWVGRRCQTQRKGAVGGITWSMSCKRGIVVS